MLTRAREWSSPDAFEGVADDKRPTARLDLTEWRKRVQRMHAATGGLRSSGLFHAVRVQS